MAPFRAKNNNNRPPKDLNALLSEVEVAEDVERSHWIQAFRSHLKTIGRKDVEPLLDFVSLANILKQKTEDRHKVSPCQALQWKRDEIDLERYELLNFIGHSYFSEDTPTKIVLSNRILRDELWSAFQNLESAQGKSDLDGTFQLVWQARCDYKVWKGGLDKAYNAYLASKPTLPTLTAQEAGLSSLNELTVHAVAMETWQAFQSQDGLSGSRNALGQVLFPSNVATRSRYVSLLFWVGIDISFVIGFVGLCLVKRWILVVIVFQICLAFFLQGFFLLVQRRHRWITHYC
eukprot:snap_masked-scaffold101_size371023-processed-gene-1.3 protein:Tk03058 transcript:snap_masked-scaffold101_size371023-processed-gene-1.3-mRNA-1 annotation:"hypothetical protein COCSUDRAFT_43923"